MALTEARKRQLVGYRWRDQQEQMSRAELVDLALEQTKTMRLPAFNARPAVQSGFDSRLSNVLGLWRNPDGDELVGSFDGIDGLAYQRRIRSE